MPTGPREDWVETRSAAGDITTDRLGWDITDFGTGDSEKRGLFLILKTGA
ncbi:MAG: D-lyxose/D-mannose family sugar isomerase [Anaerolineales bacterium]|nr:D-lyxose/D-mannose family sugar isomerase [Anaerolineales bacterium]